MMFSRSHNLTDHLACLETDSRWKIKKITRKPTNHKAPHPPTPLPTTTSPRARRTNQLTTPTTTMTDAATTTTTTTTTAQCSNNTRTYNQITPIRCTPVMPGPTARMTLIPRLEQSWLRSRRYLLNTSTIGFKYRSSIVQKLIQRRDESDSTPQAAPISIMICGNP